MKETIKEWEQETNKLAKHFSTKYFGNYTDSYWIASDIGGIFFINDYFFNLKDMVDFIKYGYSEKKMFDYYDKALVAYQKKENPICIRDFIKLEQ